MGFIDEIKGTFSASEIPIDLSYRAVIFGDDAVYVEKVKRIISYEPTEMNFSLKKGGLRIRGSKLYVKKYCMGDICVCGKITAIERIF